MTKVVKLYENDTNLRQLKQVCDYLLGGGVIIYPTDSFYAYGCAISSVKAINTIKSLKGKSDDNLSIICSSISMASEYAKVDNRQYKILRDNTPDAVTFILTPSSNVPNKFLSSKKSVGIRIISNKIAAAIVDMLGMPIASSSLPMEHHDQMDRGNASLVYDAYACNVEIMVDGGDLVAQPTTVVDIRENDVVVLREGSRELEL